MVDIDMNDFRSVAGVINREENIFTVHTNLIQSNQRNILTSINQKATRPKPLVISGFKVKLRRGRLRVQYTENPWDMHLLSGRDRNFWDEWLQVCPAGAIYLDPRLDLSTIEIWCELGMKYGKKVFLSFERSHNLPKYNQPRQWWVKRCLDWLLAGGLLLLSAPLLLVISLLLRGIKGNRAIAYQWHVGQSGRLFPAYYLHLASFPLHKYKFLHAIATKLVMLPRLINVCRGEMSLLGIYPRSLPQVLSLSNRQRRYLNVAPGIFHICQSDLLADGKPIHPHELKYLRTWNLFQDLKQLARVIRRGMI